MVGKWKTRREKRKKLYIHLFNTFTLLGKQTQYSHPVHRIRYRKKSFMHGRQEGGGKWIDRSLLR
jgi:hypothetical protein